MQAFSHGGTAIAAHFAGDDIWEARIQFGGDAFRILGFEHGGRFIILTSGFAKKTQKTPQSEIALAEQRKKEYLKENDL